MATPARVQGRVLAAAQDAMAMVFPAPGGPVTEVSEPRAPSAMSFSMRGRATAPPGTSGTVTLDIRTGSSVSARPRRRAIPRTSVPDILVFLSGDVIGTGAARTPHPPPGRERRHPPVDALPGGTVFPPP